MTITETTATAVTLDAEHLYSLHLDVAPPVPIPGGPQGTRMILPVTGGTFEGARLRGEVVAPSADWATMRSDGSSRLDIRLLLVADDGAPILVHAEGVALMGADGITIRNTQRYEAGDEAHAWLNSVQSVGLGSMGVTGVDVEVYRLL